jgi:hypothetical protein
MRTPFIHRLLACSGTALLLAACSFDMTGIGDAIAREWCPSLDCGTGYGLPGIVRIEWDRDTIAVGDTLRAVARIEYPAGTVLRDARFTWSTGIATVATVDSTGLIRAVGAGGTAILADGIHGSGATAVTGSAYRILHVVNRLPQPSRSAPR